MTRRDRLAKSLLRPINPSWIVILGFYTVVWGLWIFCPFWSVFDHAPLYATMAHISSEYVWGAIATVSGSLIVRGAVHPSYENLHFGAFVGALLWLTIALLYFCADWASTGGITALAFASYSGLVWVNVKVNKTYYLVNQSRDKRKFGIRKSRVLNFRHGKLR